MFGSFTHDNVVLTQVLMNETMLSSIHKIMASIAVYCKWEFEKTRAQNYNGIKTRVYKKVLKEPWAMFPSREKTRDIEQWKRKIMAGHVPYIKIEEETENVCNYTEIASLEVEPMKLSLVYKNGNRAKITGIEVVQLSDNVSGLYGDMLLYVSPAKMLHKLVSVYNHEHVAITKKILIYDFSYKNLIVENYIPLDIRASVSNVARAMITRLVGKVQTTIISYLYCFCRTRPSTTIVTKFNWAGEHIIDLNMNEGLFVLSEKQILLNKEPFQSKGIETRPVVKLLLPQYRIEKMNDKPKSRITSVKALNDNLLENGKHGYIYMCGEYFKAIRDVTQEYSVCSTVYRSLELKSIGDMVQNIEIRLGLKRSSNETAFGGESSKILRLEETIAEGDDDDFMGSDDDL
jgi:hypothetical protein